MGVGVPYRKGGAVVFPRSESRDEVYVSDPAHNSSSEKRGASRKIIIGRPCCQQVRGAKMT